MVREFPVSPQGAPYHSRMTHERFGSMFTLDQVVPWGRSFDEHRRMFALSDADLRLRILACADGPASFNAEATRRGATVISCDPLYRWATDQVRERISATYDTMLEETRRNADEFVWSSIRSVEELGRVRMAAMQAFLDDFSSGKAAGRYVEAELPVLPFADASFDLALCSHFLFLYTIQLGEEFHRSAILEMCRVAKEVRIFPLLALGSRKSPYVEPSIEHLRIRGFEAAVVKVPYEFQRGGDEMMRIRTTRTHGRVPEEVGRVPPADWNGR